MLLRRVDEPEYIDAEGRAYSAATWAERNGCNPEPVVIDIAWT